MSEDPKSYASVIDMLTHDCHKYAKENARLKAEVERLTKELEKTDCMFAMASSFARDWQIANYEKCNEEKSPSFIEDLGNGVEKHDLLFRYPAKEGKQS